MNESAEESFSSIIEDQDANQAGVSTQQNWFKQQLINDWSLSLARFSLKDSIDLDVITDSNTSTSRIEADEEDNGEPTRQRQKTTKATSSTPVTSSQQNLPKSILRSGKQFRRSRSSEFVLDNNKNKLVLIENKDNNKQVNFNVETNRRININSKHTQTTQNTNFAKMVDVGEINALVFNNIPILSGEFNTKLRSEVNLFIKCCERVEACLKEESDKQILLQLIGTRIRGRAAEVLEGEFCNSVDSLKKVLNEKLLQNRPYHVLRGELQTLYQYPGETVENFGNRLLNLLKECKESVTIEDPVSVKTIQNDLEEQALYIFKAGLNNTNLRWFCLSDNEKTLSALLQKAIKLEATDRIMNFSNRQQIHNESLPFTYANYNSTPYIQNNINTPYNYANNQSPDIGNDQRVGNFRQNHLFNQNKNNSNKQFAKCNFCGKTGHYFSECRTRKNTPFCGICKLYGHLPQYCRENNRTSNNNQKQVQNINRNRVNKKRNEVMFCDFCKRRNHITNDCKIKQEWESKNGVQPSGN